MEITQELIKQCENLYCNHLMNFEEIKNHLSLSFGKTHFIRYIYSYFDEERKKEATQLIKRKNQSKYMKAHPEHHKNIQDHHFTKIPKICKKCGSEFVSQTYNICKECRKYTGEIQSFENKRKKGFLAELKCSVKLTELGYIVYKPITDASHTDLVIEDAEGKFHKIQCKTGWVDKQNSNRLIFLTKLSSSSSNNGKIIWTNLSYIGIIDYFMVYCFELNKYYLIHISYIPEKSKSMVLNLNKNIKINNQFGLNYAESFEI